MRLYVLEVITFELLACHDAWEQNAVLRFDLTSLTLSDMDILQLDKTLSKSFRSQTTNNKVFGHFVSQLLACHYINYHMGITCCLKVRLD